jgi:cation diffusion facilitator CzcD-associated flavoprotein CzcO
MLQRSPTYVVSRPDEDPIANKLRRHLSEKAAYRATRWKNVLLGMLFYRLSKRRPDRMKAWIVSGVKAALGPEFDVATHFTPRYKPWDQRMCLVPNGDLFNALKSGRASVVTDHIESFTEKGIKLRSGAELEADLIVTATGLNLQAAGGVQMSVDGKLVETPNTMTYKGMMYCDVPNFAVSTGYTNASWTLKCDLTCEYVCRLLNHMQKSGTHQCTPRNNDPSVTAEPWVDFTSGYIQRSLHQFPKQGSKMPWRLHQNYARDLLALRYGKVDDGVMEFSKRASEPALSGKVADKEERRRRREGQPEAPRFGAR